ncbi:MAG TPA: NrtA/SsuA/CpmA family ABC transporter substrate-binding protein [Syntrophales bacterium]|nr:NrtA/SsuA/CpmA family ABC transporter substrate-binding protein [Syntrophales bacterium]
MNKSRDHFRYAALLLVGIAFIAWGVGCQPSQKQSGPPEKVTIALATITDAALAIIAQKQGYFLEEGLEVATRLHPFGKPCLQDVLDGKADFATVAEAPVMFAIMKGEKVAIIATIQTTNQSNAIIARRDRGIGTFGDLRGRKVAVTLGTTLDYFLDAILAARGISRKEVKIINMPADKMTEALERGDVDAASMFHPYTALAQKKLGGNVIAFPDKDIYTSTENVAATQTFIGQNPGKVVKLLRALVRAEEFVRQHPAEAQKTVAELSGLDVDIVRDAWAGQDFAVTLDQSLLLEMEDEARWAIRYGLTGGLAKIPNLLDFIYAEGLASVKPKAVNILR